MALRGVLKRLWFPVMALLLAAPAHAQAPSKPAPDEPRFEIRRFIFDGGRLVPIPVLEEQTQRFVGKDRTFADVQRALETIERVYSQRGYSAVQIVLPEQELDRGEIRFQIIEAKIGRVLVEGNKFFDEANIRASLPSLQPGQAPNINQIARDLRIANESPAKQTTVLLRSGQEEATVDAVARVVDENPLKGSITVDSSGSQKSGRLRVAFGFQNANVSGTDHVATVQYVTAPYQDTDPDKDKRQLSLLPSRSVFIVGASYKIPLYSSGNSLDFTAAYSNVNSGTVSGFNITGAGGVFSARYTNNLARIGDYDHRIAYSWDFRGYQNKGVRATGSTIQATPDVTVHPISVEYAGVYRRQDSETSGSIMVIQNLPGGNDGGGTAFCNSRQFTTPGSGHFECANGRFQVWRYLLNHNLSFSNDWQARFGLSGQLTRDMLISGEQYGIGGVDSVRGFLAREIVSDYGQRGTIEFYTPDWGGWTGIAGARARAVAFYDWGWVRRIRPSAGEPHGQSIASVGAGLRFSRGTNFVFRTDYGLVVDPGGSGVTETTRQNKGDGRLTFSLSYVY